MQEVDAYCQAQGYSSLAQPFVDYYESVGWLVGKKPMRDWKAAVRNWNRKEQRMAAEQPGSFALAPAEDPFEAAIREGRYV